MAEALPLRLLAFYKHPSYHPGMEGERETAADELAAIERAVRRLTRGAHLGRLHRRLSADAGVDLDRPSYIALACLVEEGPLSLSALADACGVEVSTMSRLVDRLTAAGLVDGQRSATDQRVTILRLSERGADLVARLKRVRRATLASLLADWTPVERTDFARLLARFAAGIEAVAAPRPAASPSSPREEAHTR
jgi:DNA-binding MarR family transcriptional regulator